jgi:DNA-binding MarR family transcriptional regulator
MSFYNAEAAFLFSHALLHTKLQKRVDMRMSLHGISFTEFMILHQLNEAPGQSLRRIDLAESVGLSASGVTRLLAPMEKIGLVQKEANPRDARVSMVRLSDAGKTLYGEASETLGHGAVELLEPLTENQLAEMMKYTEKLL